MLARPTLAPTPAPAALVALLELGAPVAAARDGGGGSEAVPRGDRAVSRQAAVGARRGRNEPGRACRSHRGPRNRRGGGYRMAVGAHRWLPGPAIACRQRLRSRDDDRLDVPRVSCGQDKRTRDQEGSPTRSPQAALAGSAPVARGASGVARTRRGAGVRPLVPTEFREPTAATVLPVLRSAHGGNRLVSRVRRPGATAFAADGSRSLCRGGDAGAPRDPELSAAARSTLPLARWASSGTALHASPTDVRRVSGFSDQPATSDRPSCRRPLGPSRSARFAEDRRSSCLPGGRPGARSSTMKAERTRSRNGARNVERLRPRGAFPLEPRLTGRGGRIEGPIGFGGFDLHEHASATGRDPASRRRATGQHGARGADPPLGRKRLPCAEVLNHRGFPGAPLPRERRGRCGRAIGPSLRGSAASHPGL